MQRHSRPSAATTRFGAPHPFQRLRQAMRGNHAIPVRRSMPALPKTRQAKRRFLFRAALAEVNQRNSTKAMRQGKECWFDIMPRAERRNLARAYAAGEWNRSHALLKTKEKK